MNDETTPNTTTTKNKDKKIRSGDHDLMSRRVDYPFGKTADCCASLSLSLSGETADQRSNSISVTELCDIIIKYINENRLSITNIYI